MKRKRHTSEQVIKKLRDADAMAGAGRSTEEICKALEIGPSTLHRWKSQYGAMPVSEVRRLRELEVENRRLKKVVADLTLDNDILKEAANW